jgi:hypothetical protein
VGCMAPRLLKRVEQPMWERKGYSWAPEDPRTVSTLLFVIAACFSPSGRAGGCNWKDSDWPGWGHMPRVMC